MDSVLQPSHIRGQMFYKVKLSLSPAEEEGRGGKGGGGGGGGELENFGSVVIKSTWTFINALLCIL